MLLAAAVCGGLAGGCTTGVIPAGPDTYMVSATGMGFGTGGVRTSVYRKANEFCAGAGLVMVPVSCDAKGGQPGVAPTADLTFRALRPGDPEIKRPNVEKPDYIQRVQMR